VTGKDRQFFLLVQARSYVGLRKIDMAESSYLKAIKNGKQHNFLEAAYNELLRIYVLSKQGMKIEPLVKRAAADRRLYKNQRQIFANLLKEIRKAGTQQQKNGR